MISIFASHITWQLRWWIWPLISTRHSKQVPIPQSGARGWPETDARQTPVESSTATATVDPAATSTGVPFTRTVRVSDMRFDLCFDDHLSRRQIRLGRNRGSFAEHLRANQLAGCQRSGDPQSFMTGRDVQSWIFEPWTDQRKFVRSRGTKTRPDADARKRSHGRQVLKRPLQHARENR